jgi:hypothetical protein
MDKKHMCKIPINWDNHTIQIKVEQKTYLACIASGMRVLKRVISNGARYNI